MWLQPLVTECVINKSMKAQSKHRTCHKMKHIYIYNNKPNIQIHSRNIQTHFCHENEIQLQL